MPYWVHPKTDSDEEKRLVAAWNTFKAKQKPIVKDTVKRKNDYEDAFDENEAPLSDTIDLNKADSATVVRLKGIGPVTAGRIVERRMKKGPFTNIEQLKETGRFSASTFEILKKHLRVETQ
jgi:DNA uptake protein ComE-like DNA-binding protein